MYSPICAAQMEGLMGPGGHTHHKESLVLSTVGSLSSLPPPSLAELWYLIPQTEPDPVSSGEVIYHNWHMCIHIGRLKAQLS